MALSEFETQVLLGIESRQREQGETLIRIEGRLDALETSQTDRANRQKVVVGAIASVIATAVSGLVGIVK